jgi:hypothetical protein
MFAWHKKREDLSFSVCMELRRDLSCDSKVKSVRTKDRAPSLIRKNTRFVGRIR